MVSVNKNPCPCEFQHTAARRRLAKQQAHITKHWQFQHTAARRRLRLNINRFYFLTAFQHTAARRRLNANQHYTPECGSFNTQPPEGGCQEAKQGKQPVRVSTHSRPKAADAGEKIQNKKNKFQHTAARRRLFFRISVVSPVGWFQHTAARRRLRSARARWLRRRGFNTQPPEGGWGI